MFKTIHSEINIKVIRQYIIMHSLVDYIQVFFIEVSLMGMSLIAAYCDFMTIGFNIYKKIINFNLYETGGSILYEYSKMKVKWQRYWDSLYQRNEFAKYGMDILDYGHRYVISRWNNVLIEPFGSQWIDTIKLCENPLKLSVIMVDNNKRIIKCGCKMTENYYNNPDLPKENVIESYALGIAMPPVFLQDGTLELLMLMKTEEFYLSRIVKTPLQEDDKKIMFSLAPSSARFLSVEYCHPKMEKSIMLNLDRGFYLEGNHLFSAAFVCRMLKYQNSVKDYYFDTNYTLKLMDNDISMLELSGEQYVALKKEGYKIVNI
jgi:hypothetical protein